MKVGLTVLLLTAATNITISLIVFLRNYRKSANIIFATTSLGLIGWISFNFMSQNLHTHNLLLIRLTGFCAMVAMANFYVLSTIFPVRAKQSNGTKYFVIIFSAITYVLCFTNLMVASVTIETPWGVEPNAGPLGNLFPVYLLVMAFLCFHNFYRQRRHATRLARSQLQLLVVGIFITAVLTLLSNLVIPMLTEDWSSSKLGTLFTIPFIAVTAYSVLKQHMFDVRSVVARVTTYVIAIGVIATLYSLVLITVIARFVSFDRLSDAQLIALALPTIISALTFQYLKQTIDKLTTRVFYKNAYKTHEVLTKLSGVLVSENDIQCLMENGLRTLTNALHSSSACLAVVESGKVYAEFRTGAKHSPSLAPYIDLLRHNEQPIHLVDDEPKENLAHLMAKDQHDLILRLGHGPHLVGLIAFGAKKSGSIYTTQDIELLKIAANNFAVALENAKKYAQIQHFADTLKEEVTHATTRLRRANERLKTVDELKDDFISMASHQFRTPAGSIRQALHMINEPDIDEEDKREMLKLAEANSEQLATIVSTMLSISRLQAGRFMVDKSLTDMCKLIDTVLSTTTILAEQKNITLKLEKPDYKLLLNLDSAKIKEAMTNYIENAIKYSPPNSTVAISIDEQEGKVVFEVHDQGIGIPEEDRKQLFNKFYRAPNARREQPEGNGIGLYVVKSIAEVHGGEAYFRPGNPGSTFGFWIPNSTAHTRNYSYNPLEQTGKMLS